MSLDTGTLKPNTGILKPVLAERDLALQFATPLMMRQYSGVEEMNSGLERLLLKLEKAQKNNAPRTTKLGGFHTGTKLFNRDESELRQLREIIGDAILDFTDEFIQTNCTKPPDEMKMRIWGWGIVMRASDFNHQHVHPDAKISGVYYVSVAGDGSKVADDNPEGSIMFADPRPRARMNRIENQITEVVIDPEPGKMILFPSYYEHAVFLFRCPGTRICIAFNARF